MLRTLMVAVLVGGLSLDAQAVCVGDMNADGAVNLGELQMCVDSFLGNCDTPTPTLTATPTPTLGVNDCCDAGFLCGPPTGGGCPIGVPAFNSLCDGGAGRCVTLTPTPTPTLARFVDNHDGTITDQRTGLMWEKKIDGVGIHGEDTEYTWADAIGAFIGGLNSGSGFANHTDWRLPNVEELQTIVDYGTDYPAIDVAFHAIHGGNCYGTCRDITIAACACTHSGEYWSATVRIGDPSDVWIVDFYVGDVFYRSKTMSTYAYARAVRGGSLSMFAASLTGL